jgi:hypothetical protein
MLLALELEEFFAVHDSSSGRTPGRAATAARGKRDTHALNVHLCSSIKPSLALCF